MGTLPLVAYVVSAHVTPRGLTQGSPGRPSSHSISTVTFYPRNPHMMFTIDYTPAILHISNSKYCCFGSLLGWAFYSTLFEADLLGIAPYFKSLFAVSFRRVRESLFTLTTAWL